MAEKNINNKTLAKMTGLNPVSISRLKNTDELKQISGHVLNQLCNALECTPNDLIEFSPDENEPEEQNSSVETELSRSQKLNRLSDPKPSSRSSLIHSCLGIPLNFDSSLSA